MEQRQYCLIGWPPSVNSIWRVHDRRAIMSARGRAWYRQGLQQLAIQGLKTPLTGFLSCSLTLHPPDRRKRDIDNLAKPILDLLTKAAVWIDDEQVYELTIRRGEIQPGGSILIEISAYECDQKAGTAGQKENDAGEKTRAGGSITQCDQGGRAA